LNDKARPLVGFKRFSHLIFQMPPFPICAQQFWLQSFGNRCFSKDIQACKDIGQTANFCRKRDIRKKKMVANQIKDNYNKFNKGGS
jgi:hypothetical protein